MSGPPLTPIQEEMLAVVASMREYLGFPPEIDREDLAERVLDGSVLQQHERRFVADWLRDIKPNHRPPRIFKALKAESIVRYAFMREAMDGRWPQRKVVAKWCGVSPDYVGTVLRKTDPEKRKAVKAWAENLVAARRGDVDVDASGILELIKWK